MHLKLVRSPAFIVDTSAFHDLKRRAIACYSSQFPETAPKPTVPERVDAAASWWGSLIGARHGEPFYAREPVGVRGFSEIF